MHKYNWNKLAKDISKLEGKLHNLNIGEIKEVLKCLKVLKNTDSVIMAFLLEDYFKANKKK